MSRPPDDIRLIPAVDARVRLGDWGAAANEVLIEDMSSRERWSVTPLVAAVLVSFAGGRAVADVRHALDRTMAPPRAFDEAVAGLCEIGVLTRCDVDPAPVPLPAWADAGWRAARDFHLYTDDYPFLDYGVDGHREDKTRMAAYRSESVDPLTRIKADVARARKGTDTGCCPTLESRWLGEVGAQRTLTSKNLMHLLDLTFSFRIDAASFVGRKLRRTSPSGGARHPSEAFVFVIDIPGAVPGTYEWDSVVGNLEQVSDEVPSASAVSGFYPPYSDHAPQAVVAIYSDFGRNRFRYREPRTVRTVFMDAGHLANTLEECAAASGVAAHIHHSVDEAHVDALVGAQLLRSGFAIGVGLGVAGV